MTALPISSRRVVISLLSGCVFFALAAGRAYAGTYYVFACSGYGNAAPAFSPQSDALHMTTANECLQPGPGGLGRSLEINGPVYGNGTSVAKGYGANWTARTPSPAIAIV